MSGIQIVGALLQNDANLTQKVPPERMKAGKLPDSVVLPALLLRSISLVERQTLKRGHTVRTAERIAVTVRAASYRDQAAIIRMIRAACAGRQGIIAGFSGVAVHSAGTGPDLLGPGDSFEQTQDFRVSYDAPA